MVKVERITKEKEFVPVVLTLESQEELDFLYGLLNLSEKNIKNEATDFDSAIDWKLYRVLNEVL